MEKSVQKQVKEQCGSGVTFVGETGWEEAAPADLKGVTFGFFESVGHLQAICNTVGTIAEEEQCVYDDSLRSQDKIPEGETDDWTFPALANKKIENAEKTFDSLRLVKLQIDRETAVFHHPSGFGYRSRQCQ